MRKRKRAYPLIPALALVALLGIAPLAARATALTVRFETANLGATLDLIFADGFELPRSDSHFTLGNLGSAWHPDSDGDGVSSDADNCVQAYNPGQANADGDASGNACDPDFAPPTQGGAVTDLRVEHATAYGAWLSFTSPHTTEYGWDAGLVWSTNLADLASASAMRALFDQGKGVQRSVLAVYGEPIYKPIILNGLEPDSTYYFAMDQINWDGSFLGQTSNIVEVHTLPAPSIELSAQHPRAWASVEEVAALGSRYQNQDAALLAWEAALRADVLNAPTSNDNDSNFRYCGAAALLYHASGDSAYRDAALALHAQTLELWSTGAIYGGHSYRWSDAALAVCTDYLWNELTPAQRTEAVSSMLDVAETFIADGARMTDTDVFASLTRSYVANGVVACQAPGLSDSLSDRGCAVLEHGLRMFFGVQAVKMRRDDGFFAMSGAALPDGIQYGRGTSNYWLQTLQTLANNGIPMADLAPWILRNFYAMNLYTLSPSENGFTTWGDVQDVSDNAAVEPNSMPVYFYSAQLLAWQMGLLHKAGLTAQAGWARDLFYRHYDYPSTPNSDAVVLMDSAGIARLDHRQSAPLAYLDSGTGQLFDRSSWSAEASYLVFKGGWSGVDHTHADQGHFQLYRNGRWVTHESVMYEGSASDADGHNVPLLQIGNGVVGQYRRQGSLGRITRAMSTGNYTYALADITGSYRSNVDHSYNYDAVQRSLFWLKSDDGVGADSVVIYDQINNAAGAPVGLTRFIQFHLDEEPLLNGRQATLVLDDAVDQRVAIDLLYPASTTLSLLAPESTPDVSYGGGPYTWRVQAHPNSDDPQLRMLSVFRVTDAEQAQTVTPQGIDSADVLGVQLGAQVVAFPRALADAEAPLAFSVQDGANLGIYLAGLKPETSYAVTTQLVGDELEITVTVGQGEMSNAAGVLEINF